MIDLLNFSSITFLSLDKKVAPAKNKTVLVLNSYDNGWRQPLLVDAKGRKDQNIDMVFGPHTSCYQSCSVTYRNRFYVFGGWNDKRQISEVMERKMRNIGSLDFDYYDGGCSNVDDREIYLCFYDRGFKKCRSGVDPRGKFTVITYSRYEHGRTRIAASKSK